MLDDEAWNNCSKNKKFSPFPNKGKRIFYVEYCFRNFKGEAV
jgi:hypothetical protein